MMTNRKHAFATLFVLCALLAGCASSGSTKAPPQTQVAHYGAQVLQGAEQIQRFVTEQTTTGLIPVEVGRQITDTNQRLHDAAQKASIALRAYDAATTFDLRNTSATQVQEQIAAIQQALSQLLNVQIPDNGVTAQLAKLVGATLSTVAAVQAEIAKGLGGQ